MNKKLGLFIFLGLTIGASSGVFIGAAIENTPLGIALGAVGGLFVGWFIAVAVLENETSKKRK
jgi:ABC-type uncharacterized transport system permease subunit